MIYPLVYTTGIHYTDTQVEWVVLRKSRKGIEKIRTGSVPIVPSFFEQEHAPLFPAGVLQEIRKNFRGVITVSLPSAHLLIRMLELPSTNPQELKEMVELQVDAISPFPSEQLTISYEVLRQTDDSTRVLALAAPRKTVDELGDLFKAQNVYIRSLDAEVLAWWSLLSAHDQVCREGRTVLILEEHTEFSMIVTDDGIPVSIRSLELFHDLSNESVLQEIVEEVRYTLLSLEAEYGRREMSGIFFWSQSEVPPALRKMLHEQCGSEVTVHDLESIPVLAEGLALRSAERTQHHAELVPREWVDLQRRRRIMKACSIGAVAVLSIWLAVVAVTGIVFSIRQAGFNRIRKEAEKFAAPARAAQAAREEMLSLEKYADRTHSALECLREVTVALPAGIEISSFNYKKGEAVSLRGSCDRADIIYDYFQNLGGSELFKGVKDQPVSTRMIKDRRVSTFAITAELPKTGKEEQP